MISQNPLSTEPTAEPDPVSRTPDLRR
jgi:hypothetical protein